MSCNNFLFPTILLIKTDKISTSGKQNIINLQLTLLFSLFLVRSCNSQCTLAARGDVTHRDTLLPERKKGNWGNC